MTNDLRDLEGARRTAEREVPVVTFTLQRPEAKLEVLGEAGFQGVLERYSGGRDEDGAVFRHHPAVLLSEPYNRYDRDAISVRICDELGETDQIGYLSHDDAVAYAPVLDLVSPAIPMSLVTLEGGWDRWADHRANFAAVLNLGSPAEMAAEWYYHRRPPTTRHRWSGMTVTFVGESLYSIGDIRLDSQAQAFLAVRAGCAVEPFAGPEVQVYVTGQAESGASALKSARRNRIPVVPEGRFWQDVDCYLQRAGGIDPTKLADSRA